MLVSVALILALLIKTFLVQAYFIDSGSMQRTLAIGSRVLINKLAYELHDVHRGDVVVFNGAGSWDPKVPGGDSTFETVRRAVASAFGSSPPGVKIYIKRVVGIPGDHVKCCDERNRITVNGVPLNGHSYLFPGNMPSQGEFNTTVPPGRLWVMGDHRAISADSRAHLDDSPAGTIPIDKVVGRAFAITWPPSEIRLLNPPRTFTQPALADGKS